MKRRRLNDYKADEAQSQKAIRKPYIRPSKTLQDPLLGGFLSREHGSRHSPEEVIGAGIDGPELIFQDSEECDIPMPAFAWDPVTRGLCIPRTGHQMLSVCPENPDGVPLDYDTYLSPTATQSGSGRRKLLYKSSDCMNLVYERDKITSIHVNESARLAATTWMDNGYFGIVIVFLQNEVALPHTLDRLVSDGECFVPISVFYNFVFFAIADRSCTSTSFPVSNGEKTYLKNYRYL